MFIRYDIWAKGVWTRSEDAPTASAYAHAESVWLVPGSFDPDAA